VVLRGAGLVALVAGDRLAAVGLKVDAEQRETVQSAEELHRSAAVHPFHHVEVGPLCAAPFARDVLLMLRAVRRHARRTAEPATCCVEVECVRGKDVVRRRLVALAALVREDAVVVAKLGEAGLAA